ncbi:hypothetical protein B0I37DRAFT_366960 [Chaetomium sp. MPI-CAGE-AT-0009]|nr:hypothetical protein B0I37DRAFT_366960 [Chaetomium sp. MPI-CAGE-AT-0009]
MKSQLKSLKGWLRDSQGGSSFLTDFEAETWNDDNLRSYLCLESTSTKGDPFTRWLLSSVVQVYDRVLGRRIGSGEILDERTGDKSYSSDRVNRASNIFVAIMASALPVLAIFALNIIPSTEGRLGATAGFTITFAVLMGIFSSAKRAEIIAATATFAAIEVVFIGSALGADGAGDQSTSAALNCTACINQPIGT